MQRNSAEALAAEVLSWMASDRDLLSVFLGSTGSSVDELRAYAQEPEFLAGVLDFILMDDAWVAGFCDSAGHSYDIPMRARAALPGGGEVNWT